MLTYTQAQEFAKFYSKLNKDINVVDVDIALADWILLNRKENQNKTKQS